jgi:MFS transporter, FSR family, fosmidomycin resistance protein
MTEMTDLTRPALATMSPPDMRVIGTIGFAHFVSHFNLMILPPLLAIMRDAFAVSYTELGLALVVFNMVTAGLQVPIGFLVDRIGARALLIAGLVCEGGAFTIIGLVPSFYVFIAMHALAGLGNTVFHPADYAYLSKRVAPGQLGFAFSFHTFAGMLGAAMAPPATLALYALWGWRGAFIGMMALSWLATLILLFEHDDARDQAAPRPQRVLPRAAVEPSRRLALAEEGRKPALSGLALILSPPMLLNWLFFLLFACIGYGMSNYLVVALQALHGTEFALANMALSAFLLLNAVGVMGAGFYVDRIRHHAALAAASLTLMAAGAAAIGLIDLGAAAVIGISGVIGLASGITFPSRDMLVREMTPPGEFGKVFGFVTTGFNFAGILAPFVYGPLMDHDHPMALFLAIAGFGIVTVLLVGLSRRAAPQ